MRNDLKKLLYILSLEGYHTATELAEKLEISPKTVRNRIKELTDLEKQYGVHVVSKARYGFILVEEKENGIQELLASLNEQESLPEDIEGRTNYLLIYLLNHESYTKIDDLCDFLCISRSTLQSSIKEAEEILGQYNIIIDRKPNYGICIKGREFDIRRCIGECFVKRNMLGNNMQVYLPEEIDQLAQHILELTIKHEISLSESTFDNLIFQIYVALKRMKRGCYIKFSDERERDKGKYQKEYVVAGELAVWLEEWQGVQYSEEEIRYIVIYLAGTRMLGNMESDIGNFVIRDELDQLVFEMLQIIYEEFKIEMRNNFKLRMALNQHMMPFDIRMRYNIRIENPILEEIKNKYVFGWTLAVRSNSVLEKHYGKEVSEDETGYFAMLFALALEQEQKPVEKTCILIVCSAGRGSSRLIRYKYEQEFGKYLEKIYICGLHELDTFDFEKIDYVFTTVPIYKHIPVPITEVRQFLGSSDIMKVRQILEKGNVDFLDDYYRETQFFTEVPGSTREAVIRNLCDMIGKQRKLPKGFCEAVLEREEIAQTDFGNYIAMPHPCKTMTEETFVYVAVLKEEIVWSRYPVQLVFLVAIGDKKDKNLSKFYEGTTSLFVQEERVRAIIEEKNFGILMQMLRQSYYTK